MPTLTIPIASVYTQRGPRQDGKITSGPKDAVMRGGLLTTARDPLKQTAELFFEKRQGITTGTTVDSGNFVYLSKASQNTQIIADCHFTYLASPPCTRVFVGSVFCGQTDTSNFLQYITQAIINNRFHYLLAPSDNDSTRSAFYIDVDALSGGSTFTADRTSGSTTLANVSSFTGLVVGQALSGTGIASGARIESLNPGGSSLVMTIAATSGAGTSTTVTRERMSKIIDPDFPTDPIGPFSELDGTVYICDESTASIVGSDLNSIASWTATNSIPCNIKADELVGAVRYKNFILAMGKEGMEWYKNAGNPSGSLLKAIPDYYINTGVQASASPFCIVGDMFAWYGTNGGCYMLNGTTAVPISDHFVDAVLAGQGLNGVITCDGFYYKGKPYLSFFRGSGGLYTAGSSSYGFWYDVTEKRWVEPNFGLSGNEIRIDSNPSTLSPLISHVDGNYHSLDDSTTGYTDDGNAFTMLWQPSALFLNNGKPFTVKSVNLIADTETSGSTSYSVSKDDYTTFESRGSFSMSSAKKEIKRGGGWCKSHFIPRLSHSDNAPARWQALEVEWEPAL